MDYLSCSLADYVAQCTAILNDHTQSDTQRKSTFVDYALAGITLREDGSRSRIVVDSGDDLTPYCEMKSEITRKSYITKMEGRSFTLPFKFALKTQVKTDFARSMFMYDVGAWVYQGPDEVHLLQRHELHSHSCRFALEGSRYSWNARRLICRSP